MHWTILLATFGWGVGRGKATPGRGVTRRLLIAALAGAVWVLIGVRPPPARAQVPCDPPEVHRSLAIWFGTLTVKDANGAVLSTTDFVELDKRISAGLGFAIAHDPTVDQRLRTGDADYGALLPWVNLTQGTIEWTLDTTPGTDAHAALLADYTDAGDTAGPGALSLGTALTSTTQYWLGSASGLDVENNEVCTVNYLGDVTYHAVNATWALAGEQAATYCSTLGDDPKPSLLDQDLFRFRGTKGEHVTLTLEALPGPQSQGARATLLLAAAIPKVFFVRVDCSALPNAIQATLPATGTYLLAVAEHHRSKNGTSFRGDYCLTLESSGAAWQTLEPTGFVEGRID